MKKIGIVGVGIMGNGIASNYLKNGNQVFIWNRTQGKLNSLIEKGAIVAQNPKEVAQKSDIIFEITANDESSRSVWLDAEGILAGANANSILISSATVSTTWVDELVKICQEKGFAFFDMPMTGGRRGAEAGKLIFLVGGNEEKLEVLKPDLAPVSDRQIYFGKASSGIRYKLLLNMLQAIHIVGFGEVLKIAEHNGMDVRKVGNALAERPGGTTTNLAWRDYQKTPDPINFSIQWIYKDLNYAKQLSDDINLPLLNDVITEYEGALNRGMGGKDWTEINRT